MNLRTALWLAMATLVGGLAAPASAASIFDFSNLTFNGGVNSGFLPTPLIPCTAGDLCSSNVDGNVRNGALTYAVGGLHVTAAGTYAGGAAAVVQDHENSYNAATKIGAGLGVYHLSNDSSDDNINAGEMLTLTFDQVVTLSAFELRSDGHNVTNWTAGDTFLFNGASTLLPRPGLITTAGGTISSNLTGSTFTFAYGGAHANQFYLAGMTVTAVTTPVPEPESYAMLLTGLGLLGFAARRRKTNIG